MREERDRGGREGERGEGEGRERGGRQGRETAVGDRGGREGERGKRERGERERGEGEGEGSYLHVRMSTGCWKDPT